MKKTMLTLLALVLAMMFSISAYAKNPAAISNISSVADVPLITLNNGVQVPQLGLGTQIQSLERDSSESGRALLNSTSHDAVVAALQAGYRHLDTAHGYFNERGVGQAIIDSGVPREEIWVTSKLWPSEYGEGTTLAAIDAMLERLQLDYIDCIYLHHPAGDYVGAWKDLEKAYRQGKVRALGISNFDNWPEAFSAIWQTTRPLSCSVSATNCSSATNTVRSQTACSKACGQRIRPGCTFPDPTPSMVRKGLILPAIFIHQAMTEVRCSAQPRRISGAG